MTPKFESNMNRRAVVWNAAGSTMSALQSFIFLIAITRILGTEVAGDYSIGASIAQLMWIVGLFDQASYLVTDYKNRFSLEQYFAFKLLSCIAMILCSVFYVLSFDFSIQKTALALWLCAFKLVDAFGAYFYSVFQKNNRLDISGRTLFLQNASAILSFLLMLSLGVELTLSIAFTTVIMLFVTMFSYVRAIKGVFVLGKPDFRFDKLKEQFWQLFPLFLANFLYGYLANAPRYAIENVGTSTMQAYFNILFMPSFAINLCARFFLRPAVTVLSDYWAEDKTTDFVKLIGRLIFGVLIVTFVMMLAAWMVGIPLLNVLFDVDLASGLLVLLLLLFASGLMVVSDVLFYPVVIFRKQIGTVLAYGASMVIGILLASRFVESCGLMGAAIVYLIEAVVVLVAFMSIIVGVIKTKHPNGLA